MAEVECAGCRQAGLLEYIEALVRGRGLLGIDVCEDCRADGPSGADGSG